VEPPEEVFCHDPLDRGGPRKPEVVEIGFVQAIPSASMARMTRSVAWSGAPMTWWQPRLSGRLDIIREPGGGHPSRGDL